MDTLTTMNTDKEHKEAADRRFQRYQDKLDEELAFFRCKILTLALLTATATLVWSLASTENGKQVCQIIAELFK